MREKIWLALTALPFAAAALASCSSETVAPPPKPPIGRLEPLPEAGANPNIVTEKERALPGLYAEALSSGPPDAGAPFARLLPLLNPELVEFWSPGMPPAHEPANILAAHDALFGAFDDRKMELTRVWRTPNEQSIEWVMTGKQARDWMGIAATQKPVAFTGLTLLWTKDDGTIVDIHVYFDVGLLKVQLGAPGPKELLALPPPSPSSGPVQVFEPAATSSDQPDAGKDGSGNVGVVKAWLDALENSKESDYVAALAEGAEIYTLQRALPMRGAEDAKKYFRATHKAIGQLDTIVNNAWGVAQYVVVEYDLDGEQLGAFSWIPLLASAPVRNTQVAHFDIVDVCETRGGKISRIWRYDNPAQMLTSLPVPPPLDAGIRSAEAGKGRSMQAP
jgi:hypothetical protein